MRNRKNTKPFLPTTLDNLEQTLQQSFENNSDLTFTVHKKHEKKLAVFFISYQIHTDVLRDSLLKPLLGNLKKWSNEEIENNIPIGTKEKTDRLEHAFELLIAGSAGIYVEGETEILFYAMLNKEKRALEKAETESLVLGPKIAFTESIITNMNILRWRIRSNDLVAEEYQIGKTVPHEVRLVYMKSIANEADVNTMRQRLLDLDVDEVLDGVVLKQYVEDKKWSIFPQFDSTELPDRFSYGLSKGRVGVLVENSPTGFMGPVSLFSFFESTEDMFMRWNAGSALRILRFISMILSILLTPLYVAAVTYQYGLIPTNLLITLGTSRAEVPFPPLLETLILEFMIELLREAGARLPTKVGQTMGIVGGIVIGEAAVQAGLTSNILIILVAISALASFTIPSYLMSVSFRLIRFPLVILAGMLGILGISLGIVYLIIHLLKMSSLGRPYLAPLYPWRFKDFNKVFFRTPPQFYSRRFKSYRPKFLFRFSKREAKAKHDNRD